MKLCKARRTVRDNKGKNSFESSRHNIKIEITVFRNGFDSFVDGPGSISELMQILSV